MNYSHNRAKTLGLLEDITCPHCWHKFPPQEVLWVSSHPDLADEPYLGVNESGSMENRRFLPTRFSPKGQAIDMRGEICRDLACPNCHLKIPRALVEIDPMYVSILGAPSSGKSYYLGTMTWKLRKLLRKQFLLGFEDADPEANALLGEYENLLFLNQNMDNLVCLGKTELDGDLYQRVIFGEHEKLLPKPFVISIRPLEKHSKFKNRRQASRTLCLYDNAGEHFLPGADVSSQPGTQHLALSEALFFLFDPTQHPLMRAKCQEVSDDPQLQVEHLKTYRQDYILLEAAKRIRDYSGLAQTEKYSKPLIVIVAKYDIWKSLMPKIKLDALNVIRQTGNNVSVIDLGIVEQVSHETRRLLSKIAPEFVNAAASFSKEVVFIPVSAFGRSPEKIYSDETLKNMTLSESYVEHAGQGPISSEPSLGVRPKSIKSIWVEIPMLYAFARATEGLVGLGRADS
jgi:hypothetical protein